MFLASSFTLGKCALAFTDPFALIAFRMLISGGLLLGYQAFYKKKVIFLRNAPWGLFIKAAVFHIYLSFTLEFWALQYMSGAKACLLYSLSPFITVVIAYACHGYRCTLQQIIGLLIGFCGFLPVFYAQTAQEEQLVSLGFFSSDEIVLLFSIVFSCYGWILVRNLVVTHRQDPVVINGIAMSIGGMMSLVTGYCVYGAPWIYPLYNPINSFEQGVLNFFGPITASTVLFLIYAGGLIFAANIVFYTLYASLLRTYSATFLSFAGFTAPLFAAFFDWVLTSQIPTYHFFVATGAVFLGLYIFYKDELRITAL